MSTKKANAIERKARSCWLLEIVQTQIIDANQEYLELAAEPATFQEDWIELVVRPRDGRTKRKYTLNLNQ